MSLGIIIEAYTVSGQWERALSTLRTSLLAALRWAPDFFADFAAGLFSS